jgi:hypothetical protein
MRVPEALAMTVTPTKFPQAGDLNRAGSCAGSPAACSGTCYVSGDRRLTTDDWIVHSHDGGAPWTENHLAGPFDLHEAPYARGYFVGDYQGLDSQGSAFRTLFTLASPGSDPEPEPEPDGRVPQPRVLIQTRRRKPRARVR